MFKFKLDEKIKISSFQKRFIYLKHNYLSKYGIILRYILLYSMYELESIFTF